MKILALESSGLVASVAVYSDGCLMGEFSTNFKTTFADITAYAGSAGKNVRDGFK